MVTWVDKLGRLKFGSPFQEHVQQIARSFGPFLTSRFSLPCFVGFHSWKFCTYHHPECPPSSNSETFPSTLPLPQEVISNCRLPHALHLFGQQYKNFHFLILYTIYHTHFYQTHVRDTQSSRCPSTIIPQEIVCHIYNKLFQK